MIEEGFRSIYQRTHHFFRAFCLFPLRCGASEGRSHRFEPHAIFQRTNGIAFCCGPFLSNTGNLVELSKAIVFDFAHHGLPILGGRQLEV